VARLSDMAPENEDAWDAWKGTAYSYAVEHRGYNAAIHTARPEVFLTTSSGSVLPR
jgi:hypothetical protein